MPPQYRSKQMLMSCIVQCVVTLLSACYAASVFNDTKHTYAQDVNLAAIKILFVKCFACLNSFFLACFHNERQMHVVLKDIMYIFSYTYLICIFSEWDHGFHMLFGADIILAIYMILSCDLE